MLRWGRHCRSWVAGPFWTRTGRHPTSASKRWWAGCVAITTRASSSSNGSDPTTRTRRPTSSRCLRSPCNRSCNKQRSMLFSCRVLVTMNWSGQTNIYWKTNGLKPKMSKRKWTNDDAKRTKSASSEIGPINRCKFEELSGHSMADYFATTYAYPKVTRKRNG